MIGTRKLEKLLKNYGAKIPPLIPLPGDWLRRIYLEDSEERYRTGRWDHLRSEHESHRYSLIVGCCEYNTPKNRSVLDVGCGEGLLQKRLNSSKYLGIDINANAIEAARDHYTDPNVEFLLVSAKEYHSEDLYDVIIFNESLYYLENPEYEFERYFEFLDINGVIIVSQFDTNLARKVWKRIKKGKANELTSIKLSTEFGFSWRIKVYAKTHQG